MLSDLANLTIKEKDTDVAFTLTNLDLWSPSYNELTTDTCHICYDTFTTEEGDNNKIVVLDCLHVYHNHCITDWVNFNRRKECPECKTPIQTNYKTPITTPPFVGELFFQAITFNRMEKAKEYLDQGLDVNTLNSDGATALIVACKEKNKEGALFLLRQPNINIIHAEDTSGKTALHYAASSRLLRVVEQLIRQGADTEERDNDKNTVLMSSWRASLAVVNKLIEFGADVNARDAENGTILHHALLERNTDVALVLLECPDIAFDAVVQLEFPQDETMVRTVLVTGTTPLHVAARFEMFGILEKLLELGARVNTQDEHGRTALKIALKAKNFDNALALLEQDGIDVNFGTTSSGITALHHAAASSKSLVVLRKLMEKGARINAKTMDDQTALVIACANSKTDNALALLESPNIDMDLEDRSGDTALLLATSKGMIAVVNRLIERGANVNKFDNTMRTPLMTACAKTHTHIALALLNAKTIEVRLSDTSDNTALHLACMNGMLVVVRTLMTRGARINAKNKQGETPLMVATNTSHPNTALVLLERNDIDVNAVDSAGDTALHNAATNGMLLVVQKLIERQASINVRDKNGVTALVLACKHEFENVALALLGTTNNFVDVADATYTDALLWSCENGMLSVVKRLLDRGVDVNARDADDQLPLVTACWNKRNSVALTLLKHHDIEVNLTDADPASALHHASGHGMLDVVKKLIAKGADVNIEGWESQTPLIVACIKGQANVALTLLEHEKIDINLVDSKGHDAQHYAYNNQKLALVVKKLQEIRSNEVAQAIKTMNEHGNADNARNTRRRIDA